MDLRPPKVNEVLDNTIIFYGASKCGKSTAIRDVMYLLKPHIEMAVVFCPSNRTNRDYSKGDIIPAPAIQDELTDVRLRQVMERQEDIFKLYQQTRNITALEHIYARGPTDSKVNELFNRFDAKQKEIACTIKARADAEPDRTKKALIMEEIQLNSATLLETKIMVLREHINTNMAKYKALYNDIGTVEDNDKAGLDQEKRVIASFNINPRLLLILDDVTDQLSNVKPETWSELYTRGRHKKMTIVLGIHNDKAFGNKVGPMIRQAAFVSVFLTSQMAQAFFFDTKSNGMVMSPEKRAQVREFIHEAYSEENNRKFVRVIYYREDNAIKVYIPTYRPYFKFGSKIWRNFMNEIVAKEGSDDAVSFVPL